MSWENRPDLLEKRLAQDCQRAEKRRNYLRDYMRQYRIDNAAIIKEQRRQLRVRKQLNEISKVWQAMSVRKQILYYETTDSLSAETKVK